MLGKWHVRSLTHQFDTGNYNGRKSQHIATELDISGVKKMHLESGNPVRAKIRITAGA